MGGPDLLRIEIRHAPDRVILALNGELDMANVPSLQQTIEGGELDAESMVVFDLRQLEFMDSTGLRIIRARALSGARAAVRGDSLAQSRSSAC